MPISTRFSERFGLRHPVMLAPMATVADGHLAASVTAAGGLGTVGGGYGNADWLERELTAAGPHAACGFITWSLAEQPHLLDLALAHAPAGLVLSFGDPAPFANAIRGAGIPLICQVQTLALAQSALDAGADVLVAQGAEAGGHGAARGTFALVPAVVDLVHHQSPDTLVLAAGGIADGRGLAAGLMLGADGVLVGSRFYASVESPVPAELKQRVVRTGGDQTMRTTVFDVARGLDWPQPFDARVAGNQFTDDWHGAEAELARSAPAQMARYEQAVADHDPSVAAVFTGEDADLIHEVEPVATLIERMVHDAERTLRTAAGQCTDSAT
ncbi:NAD(P)H-dependent flavin oxidoreductase [Leekyejoonella antrihumi]|uniref:Nitronate monooxygenase n=1 Tax=Leekyejoonella antrihumi TaxID=1660198 RepID=A0A563DXH8_9MICO|nr:nitronate monooxygenase [Leekyejoonella antrihumi]TWP34998.1 nitronate monooxygenase [Leekyejoonella antrihumi]